MTIGMDPVIVVLVSADAEWSATKAVLRPSHLGYSPYGEFFELTIAGAPLVVFHGGWGKTAAAASTEYVIGRWNPPVIVNLGTCGGIAGRVGLYDVLLVTQTVMYDIREAIADPVAAVAAYSTDIDVAWLGEVLPVPARPAMMISADRDLVPSEIAGLVERYGAIAADWESGAIAYVASKRGVRLIILRGVSDLVSPGGGHAIGNVAVFEAGSAVVMESLLGALPALVACLAPAHLSRQ